MRSPAVLRWLRGIAVTPLANGFATASDPARPGCRSYAT